jgi:6,7-dimethyl-8-ribityllumazine synthase
MSSLRSVRPDSNAVYQRKSVDRISLLPEDLLKNIFTRLSSKDLEAFVCVSKRLRVTVLAEVNDNELFLISQLIRVLIQRLNGERFTGQRAFLTEISENIIFQNFINLRMLKKHIMQIKGQLIVGLETFDAETTKSLMEGVPFPRFMEDLVESVAVEKYIKDMPDLPVDTEERTRTLSTFYWGLQEDSQQLPNIDRAIRIRVAMLIPNENVRKGILEDICYRLTKDDSALAKDGNIDRVIFLTKLIGNVRVAKRPLINISTFLTKEGEFDRAIRVATLIPHQHQKDFAFGDICKAVMQSGDINKAIGISTLISDKCAKNHTLKDGCIALIKESHTASLRARWGDRSSEGPKDGCIALIQAHDIDKVISIAKSIQFKHVSGSYALLAICQSLLKSYNTDAAISVAALIHDEGIKGLALKDICDVLRVYVSIDQAVSIAMSIPSKETREIALMDISIFRASENIERAISIAMLIESEKRRDYTLRCIHRAPKWDRTITTVEPNDDSVIPHEDIKGKIINIVNSFRRCTIL